MIPKSFFINRLIFCAAEDDCLQRLITEETLYGKTNITNLT